MKKIWWIVGIIVVLGVAGFFAYRAYAAQRQTSTAAVNTATVTRGSITQDLSAAGSVRTGQSAQVNWQTSERWPRCWSRLGIRCKRAGACDIGSDFLVSGNVKCTADIN